jgi:glutathione S-transferase
MVYSTSQLEPAMGDALLGQKTLAQRGWSEFEIVKDVIEGELGSGLTFSAMGSPLPT